MVPLFTFLRSSNQVAQGLCLVMAVSLTAGKEFLHCTSSMHMSMPASLSLTHSLSLALFLSLSLSQFLFSFSPVSASLLLPTHVFLSPSPSFYVSLSLSLSLSLSFSVSCTRLRHGDFCVQLSKMCICGVLVQHVFFNNAFVGICMPMHT